MGILNQYGQPHGWLTILLNNPETKNIFIFLCLTGVLMFMETVYGFAVHSLGTFNQKIIPTEHSVFTL